MERFNAYVICRPTGNSKQVYYMLERLLPSAESNKYQQLEERITAATKYFQQSLGENVRSLKKETYR